MATVETLPGAVRVLDLGDGHVVAIRPVVAADADALFDLVEQLDDEDRRRRLGTTQMPPEAFFADLARSSQGVRMVAELHAPGIRRIVGEAGYRVSADGNGELTMSVAARWRGVTGPLLLDELLAAAARAGVPNVEADVELDNGPMLSVLHERGAVAVAHDHWRAVRLRIGTTGTVPTWDGAGPATRVLVEAPGGRCLDEDALRSAGWAVLTCHGPRRRRGCPEVDGRSCPLAAAADVIVVVEPGEDEPWRRLARGHHDLHPDRPVVTVPFGQSTPGAIPALVAAAVVPRGGTS